MRRHQILFSAAAVCGLSVLVALPGLAASPAAPVQLAQAAPAKPGLSADQPAAPIQLPLAPVAVPPSDEARAEARKLGEEIGFTGQSAGMLQNLRAQIIQQMARVNNKTGEETAKTVDEVLMPDFQAALPKLTDSIVDVWASNFTVAEMHDIATFYNTPAGIKLRTNLPLIGQQAVAAERSWAQPLFGSVIKAHEAELQKRGYKT